MKFSIEQHEEMLANAKRFEADRLRDVQTAQHNWELTHQRNLIYEHQIQEAKRRGCDGFDGDKFLQPKKKKTA